MFSPEFACPNCNTLIPQARIAETTLQCHACDALIASSHIFGHGPATKPGTAPRDDLPPIYLTTRDYGRLENLARFHSPCDAQVARFLSAELDRAMVCQPNEIFDDVVTLNSRVFFRVGMAREPEARVLVAPDRYFPTGQYLNILSLLGVALLGLREGSRMPFTDHQGFPCHVVVEKVA